MKSSNRIYVVITTILILEASAHNPFTKQQSYSSYLPHHQNQQKTDLVDYTSPILPQQSSKTWGSSSTRSLPTGSDSNFGSTLGTNIYQQKPLPAFSPLSTTNSQSPASSLSSSQTGGIIIEDESKANIIHIPLPAGTNRNQIIKLPISGLASNFKIVHLSPNALSKDSAISSDVLQSLEKVKADLTKIESKFGYAETDNVGSNHQTSHQNPVPVVEPSSWYDIHNPKYGTGDLYGNNNIPAARNSDLKLPPSSITSLRKPDTPNNAVNFLPTKYSPYPQTSYGLAPNQHDSFITAPIKGAGVNPKGNYDKLSDGSTVYSMHDNLNSYGLNGKSEKFELPYKNNWPDFENQSVGPNVDKALPANDWSKYLGNPAVHPDNIKPNSFIKNNWNGHGNPDNIPNSDVLYQSNFKNPYGIPHSDTLFPDFNKKLDSENLGIAPDFDKSTPINNLKDYTNPSFVPHSDSLNQFGVPHSEVFYPDFGEKQDSKTPVTIPDEGKFSPAVGNVWKDNKNPEIIPDSGLLYPGSYNNGVPYPEFDNSATSLNGYKQPQDIDKLNSPKNQKGANDGSKPGSNDDWRYLPPTPTADSWKTFIEPHYTIAHYPYAYDSNPHQSVPLPPFNGAHGTQPISTRYPYNSQSTGTSIGSNAQNIPEKHEEVSDLFKRYPFLNRSANKLPTYGTSPILNPNYSNISPPQTIDSPPSTLQDKTDTKTKLLGRDGPDKKYEPFYHPSDSKANSFKNNPFTFDDKWTPGDFNARPTSPIDNLHIPLDNEFNKTPKSVSNTPLDLTHSSKNLHNPLSNNPTHNLPTLHGVHTASPNLDNKYPHGPQFTDTNLPNYPHYLNGKHNPAQFYNRYSPYLPHSNKLPFNERPALNTVYNKNTQPQITSSQPINSPIIDGFDRSEVPADVNIQSTTSPIDKSDAPINDELNITPSPDHNPHTLPSFHRIHGALSNLHHKYPYKPQLRGKNKPNNLHDFNRRHYPRQFNNAQYPHFPEHTYKLPTDGAPAPIDNLENKQPQEIDSTNGVTNNSPKIPNNPQDPGQSTLDDNSELVSNPYDDSFDYKWVPEEENVQSTPSPIEDSTTTTSKRQFDNGRYYPRHTYKYPTDEVSALNSNNSENTPLQTTDSPSDASNDQPEATNNVHSPGQSTASDNSEPIYQPPNDGINYNWGPKEDSVQSTPSPIEDTTTNVNDGPNSTTSPVYSLTNDGFDSNLAPKEDTVQTNASPIADFTTSESDEPNTTDLPESESPNLPTLDGIRGTPPNLHRKYRPNYRRHFNRRNYHGKFNNGQHLNVPRREYKLPISEAPAPNNNPENSQPQNTDLPNDDSNYQPATTNNPFGSGQNKLDDNAEPTDSPTNNDFDNIWAPEEDNVQSTPSPIEDSKAPVNDDLNSTAPPGSDSYTPNQFISPTLRHRYLHRPNTWTYRNGKHYPRLSNNLENNQPQTRDASDDQPEATNNPQGPEKNTLDDNAEAKESSTNSGSDEILAPEKSVQSTISPIEDSTAPVIDEPDTAEQPESNSPKRPNYYHKYLHDLQFPSSNKQSYRPIYGGRYYRGPFYNGRIPHFNRSAHKIPTYGAPASDTDKSENTPDSSSDNLNAQHDLTPRNSPTSFVKNWTPGEDSIQSTSSPIEDSTTPVNDEPTASTESDSHAPNLLTFHGINKAPTNLHHNYPHRRNNRPNYTRKHYPRQFYKDRYPFLPRHASELPTDGAPVFNTNNPENIQPQTTDSPSDGSNDLPKTTNNPFSPGNNNNDNNSGPTDSPTNGGFDNSWPSEDNHVKSTPSPVEDSTAPMNDESKTTALPEPDSSHFKTPNRPTTLHGFHKAPHNLRHRPNHRPFFGKRHHPGEFYKGRYPHSYTQAHKLPGYRAFAPNQNPENTQPQYTDLPSDASNDHPETTDNPLVPRKNDNYNNSGPTIPSNNGFDNNWPPEDNSVQSTPSSTEDSTISVNHKSKTTAAPNSDSHAPKIPTLNGIYGAPPNLHHKYPRRQNYWPRFNRRHYPSQIHNDRRPYLSGRANKFPTNGPPASNNNSLENTLPQTTDSPSDASNDHSNDNNYGPIDNPTNGGFYKSWPSRDNRFESTPSPVEDSTAPITDESKTTALPEPGSNDSNTPNRPTLHSIHKDRHNLHHKYPYRPNHQPLFANQFYNNQYPYKKKSHKLPTDEAPAFNQNPEITQPLTKSQFSHRFRHSQHPHFDRFDNNTPENADSQTADLPNDSSNDQTNMKNPNTDDRSPLNNPTDNNKSSVSEYSNDDKDTHFSHSNNAPRGSNDNSNSDSSNSATDQHNSKDNHLHKQYRQHKYYSIRQRSTETTDEESTDVPTKGYGDQNNDEDDTTTSSDDSVTTAPNSDASKEDSTDSKKKKKPLHFSSLISSWYNSETTRKPAASSIFNKHNSRDSDWQIEFGKQNHGLKKGSLQKSSGENSEDSLSSDEKPKTFGSESKVASSESEKSDLKNNDFGFSGDSSENESLPTRALSVIVKIITSIEKLLIENNEGTN